MSVHGAPPLPATPGHDGELERLLRFAQEGLYALDLLAVAWRSDRLREEQAKLGGTGRQGERLAHVTAELKRLAS